MIAQEDIEKRVKEYAKTHTQKQTEDYAAFLRSGIPQPTPKTKKQLEKLQKEVKKNG